MRKLITSGLGVAMAVVLLLAVVAPVGAVSIELKQPINVTTTSATFRMNYDLGGFFNTGHVWFRYGEADQWPYPEYINTPRKWVYGAGTYHKDVTGLTPETLYSLSGWLEPSYGYGYVTSTSFFTGHDEYRYGYLYDGINIGRIVWRLWVTAKPYSGRYRTWVEARGGIDSMYIFGAEGELVLQHYYESGNLADTDSDYVIGGGGIIKTTMNAATSMAWGWGSTAFAIWRYRAIGNSWSRFRVYRIETSGTTITLSREYELEDELWDEWHSGNWWQALLDWLAFFWGPPSP